MTKRKIHIGNLRLRLPASVASSAQQFAGGIGHHVLERVAALTQESFGTARIEELSVGKITSPRGATTRELQAQIGDRVVATLRTTLT